MDDGSLSFVDGDRLMTADGLLDGVWEPNTSDPLRRHGVPLADLPWESWSALRWDDMTPANAL